MFAFEVWQHWLEQRTADLRKQGLAVEFRAGAKISQLAPKPAHEVRVRTSDALASFMVWASGECDWDIMDARTKQFVDHAWGMALNDETFEAAFERFITLALRSD